MRDVGNNRAGIDGKDRAFDGAGKVVVGTEIGEQSDDGEIGRYAALSPRRFYTLRAPGSHSALVSAEVRIFMC